MATKQVIVNLNTAESIVIDNIGVHFFYPSGPEAVTFTFEDFPNTSPECIEGAVMNLGHVVFDRKNGTVSRLT